MSASISMPAAPSPSPLRIVTADERMNEHRSQKIVINGKSGIGKTSLLWTLDPAVTLFVDYEAGDLAVEGWPGDSIRPKTWEESRDLACYVGGPNPALRPNQPYSQAHYDYVYKTYGGSLDLSKKKILFFDSLTVVSRLSLQWAKGQPEAFSDKSGKPDLRGAYGLHGQELMAWLTHLQHVRNRDVIMSCILDEKVDDYNRKFFQLQMEGSKAGLELPGIVDEVITMAELKTEAGEPYRAFVCHTPNPWGYPAKDRSGRLAMVEEPHLGKLMAKIAGKALPPEQRLTYEMPQAQPETVEQGN